MLIQIHDISELFNQNVGSSGDVAT